MQKTCLMQCANIVRVVIVVNDINVIGVKQLIHYIVLPIVHLNQGSNGRAIILS